MCLLLTFQMHPSLRCRRLATLTKRTKQSPRLNAMKSGVQQLHSGEGEHRSEGLNAMKSGVQLKSISSIILRRRCLNAMKSGVQQTLPTILYPLRILFECNEERSATRIYLCGAFLQIGLNAMKSGVQCICEWHLPLFNLEF